MISGVILILLLQLGASAVYGAVSLKGVHPDVLSKYSSVSKSFTCLDGSKTIKAAQVNDDYCDCPDGSDEPGTSACPNSWFYCRNKGHEPKLLASQFVRDGVCDCCDGSDEAKGVCENTCHIAIAEEKAKLKKSIDEYKQALAKKQEYVEKAKLRREEFATRASTIDSEIEKQTAVVAQLEGEKEKLEQEHAEKEEQARVEREAREAEEREKAAAEQAAKAEEEAKAAEQEAQQEQQPSTDAAADSQGEEQLSSEELGRKIASQWTNDPEAAGAGAEGATEDGGHDTTDSWEQDSGEQDAGDGPFEEAHDDQYSGYETYPSVPESPELVEARRKHKEESDALQELNNIKKHAAELHGVDLGTYDEFLPLAGTCLEAKATQFIYEACFFGEASQREGEHGSKTNIGKWKGFEAGHTVALFDDGEWCWQAPNRSLRLSVSCGGSERLYDLEEPSRCVYRGKLESPAACKEEGLKELEAQLARLEQIEEEIRNENVHDEL